VYKSEAFNHLRKNYMKTRRQFIQIAPAFGLVALTACSEKAPAPAPAPVAAAPTPAAPAASPAPAPAPAAAAPAPAAAAGGMVDEKDVQAVSLGYVAVATTTDKAKWKQYTEGSQCSGCALYQGAAGSEAGGCGIFTGKQVSAKGWCSAFNKKA
jgi:High potential iron-sulfur protein